MKTLFHLLPLILVMVAFGAKSARGYETNLVNIQAELVSVEKNQAAILIDGFAGKAPRPLEAWNQLQTLIKEGKAEIIAVPSVTTNSGQRATSVGITTLEVEPIVASDGIQIDLNCGITYGDGSLVLSLTLSNLSGGKQFIGSFDAAGRTVLVFIRAVSTKLSSS